MVKDENNRIPINLLLTYNKDKNMMKVLSIPRDTYARYWIRMMNLLHMINCQMLILNFREKLKM